MLAYVLDRDYRTLKEVEAIVGSFSNCAVECFADARLLLSAIEEKCPDILLIDAEIRNIALMLEALKKERKEIKLILMANSDAYAALGFEIGAFGYIVKPVSEEKFKKQFLDILRQSVLIDCFNRI